MTANQGSYFVESGGDVKGIIGDISGTTINQYIITEKSGVEIRAQPLIQGSPYLGLEKFKAGDKDKFFGRDVWIQELTEYLEKTPILLLLGASGSGKSSLIQAGVIPKLKDKWGTNQVRDWIFEPDVNPFESFYGCLLSHYKQSQAKLAQEGKEDTLIQVVTSLKKESQWIILIDQFEEIFTLTPKEIQAVFIKSLLELINKGDNSVKIILTMRADFLDKLSPYPHLGKVHDHYSRMLTDMDDSELRLAIAEPAARNGVIFEPGLIDQIIADFREQAGALPLLQYTLDLLWKNDDIQDRILNTKTYQDLGGVTGALQRQGNKIYSELSPEEQKAAEKVFIELIVLEGKEPVSRRADKGSFPAGSLEGNVLKKLIDNRLLVSHEEKGKATVQVAHEALLRSWEVLQNLIREKEAIIILRNRLDTDAKQWDELRKKDPKKADDELWSGVKLARIIELQNNHDLPNLDAVAVAFIETSLSEEKQRENRKIENEMNLAISASLYSLSLLNQGKELDACLEAIKAGQYLQKHNVTEPAAEVIGSLLANIYQVREYNRLEGHNDSINSVIFSSDGQVLASSSRDGMIKLWNVETGQEICTFRDFMETWYDDNISFSSDDKILLFTHHNNNNHLILKLWNVETRQEIYTLNIPHTNGRTFTINFSKDSKLLAFADDEDIIKIMNIETHQEICTLNDQDEPINCLKFSPDGNILASSNWNNIIKLWNVAIGEELRIFKVSDYHKVSCLDFSPDGKLLASASSCLGATGCSFDATITLWDLETGSEISKLPTNKNYTYIGSLSFSPDSKILAFGSSDKSITIWNVETTDQIIPNGHDGAIHSISFSPDGKFLASGSEDTTIKLWKMKEETKIRTLEGSGWVTGLNFSSDGKTLVSCGTVIKLWDLETGKEISIIEDCLHGLSVSLNPDGKTLACGSQDGTIQLYNIETRQEIFTLKKHSDGVDKITFSSNGDILASSSWDQTINLWDVKTGSIIRTFQGFDESIIDIHFSSDGHILVLSHYQNNMIRLWNLETEKEIKTFKGGRRFERISISPNGKILASSSSDRTGGDKTIKLWNAEKGTEICAIDGHDDIVYCLSFSPNGNILASGSKDGTIKLWDMDLDVLMGRACDWVRAYLTYNPNVSESDRHLCDGIGSQ